MRTNNVPLLWTNSEVLTIAKTMLLLFHLEILCHALLLFPYVFITVVDKHLPCRINTAW